MGRGESEAKGGTDLGSVDGLVAPGTPAGSAGEEGGVVNGADGDASGAGLLLEVAFQAEDRVALGKHLLVHGAVGSVAGEAAFAHGFVFENVGSALELMTGEARFVGRVES